MAEREAREDFYYLWDETDDTAWTGAGHVVDSGWPVDDSDTIGATGDQADHPLWGAADDELDSELDSELEDVAEVVWDDTATQPIAIDGRFDAFDTRTWSFKPAPRPWYRGNQASVVMAAAVLAAIAIVVSVVLLILRGSHEDEVQTPTSATPTVTTTPGTLSPPQLQPPPLELPPPPQEPPPPPQEPSLLPTEPPPEEPRPPSGGGESSWPRQPRVPKKPEIGVTRTPVTRSQISVAPKPR